jgi:photosystem II stability/assembly factor-like uncharacterized protein
VAAILLALAPTPAAAQQLSPAVQPELDERGHRPDGAMIERPAASRVLDGDLPADWSLLGPPGGDVFAVAVSPVDPDLVLAGTAPGGSFGGSLYRSIDGGTGWAAVLSMAGTSVLDIEFAPDGRAYLGTISGVWDSGDGGQTWTARDLGIGPNQVVEDVTLDPSNLDTVWATVGDALGGQPVNLVRSTDGGASWADRTPPLPAPMTGTGVAIDPSDPATVIAVFGGAFGGGSVWVSTDGGDSWVDRSAGLPANPMRTVAYDGNRLLVGGGQLFGSQRVGLYSSDDLGASWVPLHDASWPVLVVYDVAVDPADAGTILVATDGAGVHRTTDGGESWQIGVGGSGSLAGRALRFSPGSSSELFLGTSSLAVFRSTDAGDSFTSSAQGISELGLTSIAANPRDPAELAVSFEGQNDGGVLTSTDGGGSWTVEPVPPTRYGTVGFAPDGTLHAISTGPSSIAPEGLYRRQAGGGWLPLGPDQGTLFESDLATVRFSTDDPELILLGGADFGVAGNEATLWRSTDDGATWTKTYEAGVLRTVVDLELVDNQQAVAVWSSSSGDNVGGVLRTVDGGESWSPSSAGLPGGFFREARLCGSAGDPAELFLSAWLGFDSGGLFRTTDAGQSWQSTGWTGPRIEDLACDPVDDQLLYVSQTGGDPVARSGDRGATFTGYAAGLEAVTAPGDLAFAGTTGLLLASRQGSYATAVRDIDEPVVCDETISGVHAGALTVSEGVTCLAAGSQVLGEVNVAAGAGLVATAAVIQGPVSAVGASPVELVFSQVTGPVLVTGAGSVSLFGSQVTGSVTLLGNGGPIVSGNTIIGSLSCFGNQPPPVDHGLPNTATGGKLGECAGL